ncbi:MAG: FAD binding domain-containing protein [Euryarchaeota archaeon]|nr:FAD binding domain-containing protein [Euryarchaeota archaeon]
MSMLLPPFQLHEPTTVAEAVALRQLHPESDFLAGGTDLLPNYKWQLNTRPHVIGLHKVDELRAISPTKIGALATLKQMNMDGALWQEVPVVAQTAGLIASPLIRNSGTLGGNLMLENRCFFFNQSYVWRESIDFCLKAGGTACHVVPQETKCYATFSADLPGPLIALGATFELAGPSGTRRVPAVEFYKNDGIDRHAKRPDELLTFVHLPPTASQYRASYQKLRQRESWDFPELGIAVALKMKGETVEDLQIVANALECAPKLLRDIGSGLRGKKLTDAAIDEAAAAVETQVRPVKNTNLSPSYRKRMARVFTKRALLEARAGGPRRA